MFRNASRDAPLVLVDYGSGIIDETVKQEQALDDQSELKTRPEPVYVEQGDGTSLLQHTTFAGSAFYISPEMFGKKYTFKTDVWSAVCSSQPAPEQTFAAITTACQRMSPR